MVKTKRDVKEQKFPREIYVRLENPDNKPGEEDLNAYRAAASAVDDDGPTQVATYHLMGTRQLRKKVVKGNG
jgi:hypothetical protein